MHQKKLFLVAISMLLFTTLSINSALKKTQPSIYELPEDMLAHIIYYAHRNSNHFEALNRLKTLKLISKTFKDLIGHNAILKKIEKQYSTNIVIILLYAKIEEYPLHKAIEERDINLVHGLLCLKNININEKDIRGWSPLFTATYHGYTPIVQFLLRKGADIHTTDNYKWTPLHQAAEKGFKINVGILLAHGADIEAKNDNNETPLFKAVRSRRYETTKVLLSHNANTEVADSFGNWYPLHFAISGENIEMIKLLLDYGANKSVKTSNGKTPLELALHYGHTQIVKILKNHTKPKENPCTKK